MKRTRPEDAERSHLHSWLKELDVEPDLLLGELGGGDEEPDQPTTGGGSRPRAPSNHLSTCHGALLLGGSPICSNTASASFPPRLFAALDASAPVLPDDASASGDSADFTALLSANVFARGDSADFTALR